MREREFHGSGQGEQKCKYVSWFLTLSWADAAG